MVKVDLKGIAKVTAAGRTYWYAWRGGPRLRGEPGSPEFMASYNAAIEERRTPDKNRFKSVVVLYKASDDFKTLADTTKRSWATWLDRIATISASSVSRNSIGLKDQAGNPALAQPMGRQAADGGLWHAGPLPRPLPRCRPAGQDRKQSMRGHQATLPWRSSRNHLDGRGHRRAQTEAPKSHMRWTSQHIPACGSGTCCACRGLTSAADAIVIDTGKSKAQA